MHLALSHTAKIEHRDNSIIFTVRKGTDDERRLERAKRFTTLIDGRMVSAEMVGREERGRLVEWRAHISQNLHDNS